MKSRCFEWVSLCHQVSQFKTAVPATWFHVVSRDSTFWTVSQRSSRRRREARVAAAVPSRRATTPRGRPRSKPSPVLREESSDRGVTTAVGAAEILYLQTMSCFWVSSSSLMTATAATTAGSSRRSAVTCPFTSDATDDDEVAGYQVSHGPPFVVQTALRGRQSGCPSVPGSLHQTDNF